MMELDNKKIKEVQKVFLEAFSRRAGDFVLADGTALELYYLHHRFSVDLDFFSPTYKTNQEDVIFTKPVIRKFGGVPVYSVENIYLQKMTAITGTQARQDEIGREVMEGRHEARDAFDIYMLSKRIKPLHQFLKMQSSQIQRGMVHWYRTFSREDLKLGLLDLDIYINGFDTREMIIYLKDQIKRFIKEVLKG